MFLFQSSACWPSMPPFVFAVIGTFLQCFERFLRTFLFFFVRFGGSSDGLNFDNFRDTAPL